MAMSRVDQIDEDTLRGIWTTLPTQLCNRHRDKARNKKPTPDNPRPTDWKIEDLRKEHYSGGYPDSSYFKRHITELARRHPEIQVEDDVIRLTHQGILYCVRNVRGFEKDF
jgi:hypothetical protein